jgi:phosphoinositide-3-kinase regulatory subunit 4
LEKKWIVYQLLLSLKESHEQKRDGVPICHGDIKSENVLLTGWNWVYLSDYAPFKPTELPMDNPGDYNFYFDTSRRRTCYIAVERFIDPTHRAPDPRAPLTEAMDIFSLGCVVAEMFSDGRQLFDLSELLEYKRQQNKPQLKWVKDEDVKNLVEHMIQHRPHERYSAEEYLHVFEEIFPPYFATFLHEYMKAFTHGTGDFEGSLKPDQRIQRLYRDMHAILLNVVFTNQDNIPSRESGFGDGLVIVLSAVTSHVRVLQLLSTKLRSLEMMKMIAQHIRDEFILDRVIPYLLYFVSDVLPEVKAEAIRTLTHCLSMVTKLPKGDVNIFQDYIFPGLVLVPEDPHVSVRLALAESLADLTTAAHRFLEIGLHNASLANDDDYQTLGSYDNELSLMRTQVAKMVTAFLSDQDNTVKKTTMMHLKKLCPFFGFQQAKDVILVHLITYLNDKEDWQLHRVFFECIVDVVAYLGWPAVELVQALLLQGLNDPEEQVISKSIDAVAAMVKLKKKLFKLQQVLEFVDQIRPFLIHPNIWIRYAAVGFLNSVAEDLGPIDSACFLKQKLDQYLAEPVIDMTDQFVLLSTLKPPLLRQIYDYVLRQNHLREFFEVLTERQSMRSLTRPGYAVKYAPITDRLDPMMRRLSTMGMNESVEDQLLILQDVILKVQNSRQFASDQPPPNGMISLEECGVTGEVMKLEVVNENWYLEPSNPPTVPPPPTEHHPPPLEKTKRESEEVDEWNLMFGEESSTKYRTLTHVGKVGSFDRPTAHTTPGRALTHTASRSGHRASIQHDGYLDIDQNLPSLDLKGGSSRQKKTKHRRSRSDTMAIQSTQGKEPGLVDGRTKGIPMESTWVRSLEMLKQHKAKQYNLGQMAQLGKIPWENGFFRVKQWRSDPGAGQMKLVSHLQEHKAAINRIRVNKGSSIFATFSSDSSFKLWDATRLDQQPFILKSKYTQKFG